MSNRSSGIGMWYPEIQNRIAHIETTERQTVCVVLDKYLEDRPSNMTSESQVFFDILLNTKENP